MSSQKYERKPPVQLTQEQSAVLDGLTGWTDSGTTINYKKDGEARSFYKKYQERPMDDSTLEACNILANLGLGLYDKADSFSGVYRYTINKNTLEKELIKKGSSTYTPRSTTSTTSKSNVDWDEVNKKREERDKKFDVKHDESMQRMDDLTFIIKGQGDITTHNTEAIDNLTKEVANLCRQIQNLLGQQK